MTSDKTGSRGIGRAAYLAAAVLVLSAAVVSSFAVLSSDSDESRAQVVDGLEYDLHEDTRTATVAGYITAPDNLTIPSAVTFGGVRYSVTAIKDMAFNDCDNLLTVTIPSSVTVLEEYAFSSCTALTKVDMGNGVTEIGDQAFFLCESLVTVTFSTVLKTIDDNAFLDCYSLASVDIPASVETMKGTPFQGCSALTAINVSPDNTHYMSVDGVLFSKDGTELVEYPLSKPGTDYTVPGSVRIIDEHSFADCRGLVSVTVQEGVEKILPDAFRQCRNLTSVTLPGSLVRIGNGAFADCASLESFQIPSGITDLESDLLQNCKQLASVTVPGNVQTIDQCAFEGCTQLVSVTLSEGLVSIGDSAFKKCTSLLSVTVPASVKDLGTAPFQGCTQLTSINVAPGSSDFTSVDGVLFDGPAESLLAYPSGRPDSSYDVPSGTVELQKGSFSDNVHLTTFTLPDSLIIIGEDTFIRCKALASVTIPGTVREIGENAFIDCKSLTSLTLSEGIQELGGGAFTRCTQLASVTVPGSITDFGSGIFQDCSALVSVTIADGVKEIGSNMFDGCTQLTAVDIASSVEEIGSSAFYRCTSLVTITVPDGVTTVGQSCFSRCFLLTTVEFGKDVTSIQQNAFTRCPNITAYNVSAGNPRYSSADGVLFENGDTKMLFQYPAGKRDESYIVPYDVACIGDYAFYDATYLVILTLPEGLTEIHSYAFYFCASLVSLEIPAATTRVGDNIFYGCTALRTISVSTDNPNYQSLDGVLFNKDMSTLIQYPAGLSGEYVMPDSVKWIEPNAFHLCMDLSAITIPAGAQFKGLFAENPFLECTSLASISVAEGNPQMKSVDGILFSSNGKTLLTYPACKRGDVYTIPAGVEFVLNGAFAFAFDLEQIEVDPRCTSFKSVDGALFIREGSVSPEASYETLLVVPSGRISFTVPDRTYVASFCFTGDRLTELTFGSDTCVFSDTVYDCSSLQKITMKSDTSFTQLFMLGDTPCIVLNYGELTIQIVCPEGYDLPDAATDNVHLVYYHPAPPAKNTLITAVLIGLALIAISAILISALLSRRKTE